MFIYIRTYFGPIGVKGLKKGEWKELSLTDIDRLKQACKPADKPIATGAGAGGSLLRKTRQSYYERMIARKKQNILNPLSNSKSSGSSRATNNSNFGSLNKKKPGAGYYSRTIGRGFAGYTAPPSSSTSSSRSSSSSGNNNNKNNNNNNNKNSASTTRSSSLSPRITRSTSTNTNSNSRATWTSKSNNNNDNKSSNNDEKPPIRRYRSDKTK